MRPVLGQGPRRMVARLDLLLEIDAKCIPVARVDDFLLVAEVIQDIRRMLKRCFGVQIPPFVLGRDVGHVVGDLDEFGASIIRLHHDGFLGLDDVMLEAHNLLKAQRFAELRSQFHRLIVDGIGPVESAKRRGTIVA